MLIILTAFNPGLGVFPLDTDDLVKIFGIKSGEVLQINSIIVRAGGVNAIFTLTYDLDSDDPDVGNTIDSHGDHTMMFSIAVANDSGQFFFTDLRVRNRLVMEFVTSASIITFDTTNVKDKVGMDWQRESTELIPDVKQVSSRESKTEGSEFFQAGDFNQIGEPD